MKAEGAQPSEPPFKGQNQIVGSRKVWALAALMLVQFVSVLSSTIVANAAPAIVDDLHHLELYAWIFASFTLAATICVPVVGKLSDVLGRRIFYIVGLSAFLVGSVACGIARSMPELIAARVVAGAGAGAMLALTGATIGDIFPPRERAKWMGLIMTNYGIASMLGPIVGGVITDQFGWRWAFIVTLPLAAVALVVMWVVMPRVEAAHHVRIDWLGITLLSLGLLGVVIALTSGGITSPWLSSQILIPLSGGLMILAAFGWHELRASDPVMSPRLFQNSVFLGAVGLSFLARMAFFGVLAFFPVYLQGVLGESASVAGLQLIPLMAAFIVGNVVSGQLISLTGRYRWNAIVGPGLLVAGLIVCVSLTPTSGMTYVALAMALVGFGVGATFPLASSVVQSAFPYRILGTVNSARQFFDNLGQVIGISVMTTITISSFTYELPRRLPDGAAAAFQTLGSGQIQGLLSSHGQTILANRLSQLPDGVAAKAVAAMHQSLLVGVQRSFWFALIVCVAALAVGVFLPEIPLRTTHDSVD